MLISCILSTKSVILPTTQVILSAKTATVTTVASMLLIFPCVRLDCVSFASKTCLDYVWSVNVFMLTLWAILPAQVSLPSLVEVVSLLHTWIRLPSRPLNEDHVDFDCASVQIWGPGFHFGATNLYGGANKVYMIFIQRSAGQSDSSVQQTNNFNQRRKGNLGGQNCSKSEHEYIHRPHIVKTCFTCKRYTVKSHAWEDSMLATVIRNVTFSADSGFTGKTGDRKQETWYFSAGSTKNIVPHRKTYLHCWNELVCPTYPFFSTNSGCNDGPYS